MPENPRWAIALQDATFASNAAVLCTNNELQKAKAVLENCTFISPRTRGCYFPLIALWIQYCNEHCDGDDKVTDSRLADYIEWMASSGIAERIRQGRTHIQEVLRNQLQGVVCYWRIQNNDPVDIPDP
ncbi:hypothetical protein GGH93_005912, partial [Coemansia aciculifera]